MTQKLNLLLEKYSYLPKNLGYKFEITVKDKEKLQILKDILREELNWPEEFIEFHSKHYQYPFRELTNIIYMIQDFMPPVKRVIHHKKIDFEGEPFTSRIAKYHDFVQGKNRRYYNHTDEHPKVYVTSLLNKDYNAVDPITVVNLEKNLYEPLDGGHRITLAKMYDLKMPAWIIDYKENCNCSYASHKIRTLFL